MCILLLDGLPDSYQGTPLSPDYRNMINVSLIMREADVDDVTKLQAALHQLYPAIPSDVQHAVEGLVWFYSRGGASSKDAQDDSGRMDKKAFDFEQDANLIYAAFYSVYGISLARIDFLHWWEFMALFEGLPDTTQIKQVMYWRTADTTDMPKAERARILRLRKLVALKDRDVDILSAEDLSARTKRRVQQRFAAAAEALKQKKL